MAKHHPVTIEDYMALPYTEIVTPDEEEGGFIARVLELPGCLADGDTRAEALEELQEAKLSWLASALEAHDPIPLPLERGEYNGKVLVRMTRRLHHDLAVRAAFEGVSLNQLCVTLLSRGLADVESSYPPLGHLFLSGDVKGSRVATGQALGKSGNKFYTFIEEAYLELQKLQSGNSSPIEQAGGKDQVPGSETDKASRAPVK